MLGLEPNELVVEAFLGSVRDLGIVQNVIAVEVIVEQLA